jgi:hypothetical protein
MSRIVTRQELVYSAQEALNNWDKDLMEPGQAEVLQAIIDNPQNFSDDDGVEIHTRDIWDYLEEVSRNLSA